MQKCHSQKDKARLHLIGVGGGPSNLAVLRRLAKVPLGVVAPCLVKATLVVGLLGEGAGLFLRRPTCQPRSTLVPTGLLEDKPDVPSPENEVEKPKSLKRKRNRKRGRTLTLTFLIRKHFNSSSSENSTAFRSWTSTDIWTAFIFYSSNSLKLLSMQTILGLRSSWMDSFLTQFIPTAFNAHILAETLTEIFLSLKWVCIIFFFN